MILRATGINYTFESFRHSGLEIRDFGASWRDGFAFLTLVDSIKTNVINIAEMKRLNNRHRLDTAFNVAESELGIARLLDAEDVDVNSPDEKSIMTYVAQFLHKYPDVKVGFIFKFNSYSLICLIITLFSEYQLQK